MSNQVFPTLPGLAWNVVLSPTFATGVKKAVSGKELRTSYQAYPLWKISLNYEFLRDGNRGADLDTLAGFFLMMKGQWDSFLFTVNADSTVTTMLFGTGDGVTTKFQLSRALGAGGFTFIEPSQNINGAPSVYKNGALQTLTTHYTIDSAGVVTFVTAPAAGNALTWTGSFYYRCRFLQDAADFSNFMLDLWELKKLELVGAPGNKV